MTRYSIDPFLSPVSWVKRSKFLPHVSNHLLTCGCRIFSHRASKLLKYQFQTSRRTKSSLKVQSLSNSRIGVPYTLPTICRRSQLLWYARIILEPRAMCDSDPAVFSRNMRNGRSHSRRGIYIEVSGMPYVPECLDSKHGPGKS